MAAFLTEHKVDRPSEHLNVTPLWQTIGFALPQIDGQFHSRFVNRRGAQNAKATRLDQAGKGGRAAGDKGRALAQDFGPVIGDKIRAQRHQRQRQRRLARPRRSKDQQRTPPDRNATGVKQNPVTPCHTGRPTTKRAPSGSEVISALEGRMFSAQITPPCASTICFEIARPRPE